jgi:drug/metabolite transporter (DMT)-like permease
VLGAFFALLSAATFGLNIATARRGVIGGTVTQAIAVTNVIGLALLALVAFGFGAYGEFDAMSTEAMAWFATVGVSHFIVGRYATYRSARALGAAQSGPIQQLSLLLALALALIFLGESLTPLSALGIALILLAPLVILRGRKGEKAVTTRSGIKLDYVEGYFWGLVCAVAFGTTPLLVSFGLEGGGVLRGIAGSLLSYGSATTAVIVLMAFPAFRNTVLALDRPTAKWFAATGIFVGLSQLFVFMALSLAPVTVVQPIQRTALLFRVGFSWMINREHEIIGLSVLIAVGLSMIGVLAVTIDSETLVALVPMPTGLAEVLQWRWPAGREAPL